MGFMTGNPSVEPQPEPAPVVVDATAAETEAKRQERLRRIMELQAQKRASIYGTTGEVIQKSGILGGKEILG